ncbi:MAG: pirin family protein [Acidimicrobiales bacterium]
MSPRTVQTITGYSRIDGVVPGVRGQRSLPTRDLGVVDPFVMLDHIGPERLPEDFYVSGHMHPHRGFETLTMMFEGKMFHVDSAGFREELASGSTQNMVAGSGIQHGGDMAADPDTNVFHEVQLWVNMPASTKMEPPSIASARAGNKPRIHFDHYELEVITGTIAGETSPLRTTQPTTIAHIRTKGAGPVVVEGIDPKWNSLLYVLKGSVSVGGAVIESYQTVLFANDGDTVEFEATDPGSEILLMAGQPIGEPIAMGGPYVMNTRAEIEQAESDFAAGMFENVTLGQHS